MSKKKKNNLILPIALVAGAVLIFKNKSSVKGIGRSTSVERVVKNAWENKHTGREKIVNETLHYGVGDKPYAYKIELNKSGCKYVDSGSAMGYFTSKIELQKFVQWLYNNDGYLDVQ